MKNLILVSLLSFSIMPVFAVLPPDASIIQVHDMQMINQQRFRIEEINDYIVDISEKAYAENNEVKNLMRDMNKLLATSDDLEAITNTLNEEMVKFLKYINDLEDKVDEYSKVM